MKKLGAEGGMHLSVLVLVWKAQRIFKEKLAKRRERLQKEKEMELEILRTQKYQLLKIVRQNNLKIDYHALGIKHSETHSETEKTTKNSECQSEKNNDTSKAEKEIQCCIVSNVDLKSLSPERSATNSVGVQATNEDFLPFQTPPPKPTAKRLQSNIIPRSAKRPTRGRKGSKLSPIAKHRRVRKAQESVEFTPIDIPGLTNQEAKKTSD